jgi:hypothetical protein
MWFVKSGCVVIVGFRCWEEVMVKVNGGRRQQSIGFKHEGEKRM